MNTKLIKGMTLATAAAGLFAMGAVVTPVAAQDAKMACTGANACKGQSDCKTAKSSCKGQNGCKGQGMKLMSKADCDKASAMKKS